MPLHIYWRLVYGFARADLVCPPTSDREELAYVMERVWQPMWSCRACEYTTTPAPRALTSLSKCTTCAIGTADLSNCSAETSMPSRLAAPHAPSYLARDGNAHRFRLAVATLWDGSASEMQRYECAFPLWCRSALRLAVMANADAKLLVISRNSSNELATSCAGAELYWPEDVLQASQVYISKYRSLFPYVSSQILKLAVFSLTKFDVVLYADLDVDVYPMARKPQRHALQRQLLAFLQSPAYLASSPGFASPVNGGLLLAKPRTWIHEENLRMLRANLTFSVTNGFNNVGRPSTLGINASRIAAGAYGDHVGGRDEVRRQLGKIFQNDDWSFLAGAYDQGLLFFLLFVNADRGTWCDGGNSREQADHYWGPFKPWRDAGFRWPTFVARYLWQRLLPGDNESSSTCLRLLVSYSDRLLRKYNISTNQSDPIQTRHLHAQPLLPRVDIGK